MRLVVILAETAMAAVLGTTPAPAQSAAGDAPAAAPTQGTRTTSYDAAYFTKYAPRSALDIAQNVPGFSLQLGDSEVRGFSAAAGNVVINGARPSSKAEDLRTTLSRIPANRVQKVEVGSGDLYGAEYSAKGQVLNIILTAASGIDGNVTASANRRFNGDIIPNLSASALIKRGASSFNLSAGTERNDATEVGYDLITDFATGNRIEKRLKTNTIREHNPFAAVSWALEPANNRAIRLNLRYSPANFSLRQANHVIPVGGDERDDKLVQDYRTPSFEIGGDITRPLGGGAIKLVGLANRRKRDTFDAYYFRNLGGGTVLGGSEQFAKSKRNETVGRLSWSRASLAGFNFEVGAEAALNTLDSHLTLDSIGADGIRTPIVLPIENATVREKRAEAYINAGHALTKTLRVDVGLNYETSTLKVRGDALADRSLSFPKPSVTLDWRDKGWHVQGSLRRTVAQLDFYDFISTAELSVDRVNGGNANLLPQRAWEGRLLVERAILGTGQAKLELGYDRISLLQDRILTDDGFDAPGNIGTGTNRFATVSLDLPLDSLLWKGLRLKASGTLRKTRVNDPIDGQPRRFSGYYPAWEWDVQLRRDAGKWAYGVHANDRAKFTFFRTDELDSNANYRPYGSGFVEYRPSPRTTFTLDVDNLMDTPAARTRIRYFPDRTASAPAVIEFRKRNTHPSFQLTLRRAFGGGAGVAKPS